MGELGHRHVLEQVAVGAGLHRAKHQLRVGEGGERQHPRAGALALDRRRGLHAVHAGTPYLHPEATRHLIQATARPAPVASPLTQREHEVLARVARGLTNRQIADELAISEKTVSVHVSNLLGKLGLASRTQAALYAARVGLGE